MDVKIKFEAPVKVTDKPGQRRYPFPEMQVGDAMAVRFPVPFSCARSAASQWGDKRGWKFKTMTIDGVKCVVRIA